MTTQAIEDIINKEKEMQHDHKSNSRHQRWNTTKAMNMTLRIINLNVFGILKILHEPKS
jgi:hypothetical protein